jgi:hypothetical protein
LRLPIHFYLPGLFENRRIEAVFYFCENRVHQDFANAISSTTLDEDQLCGFVAAEHNHPWAVPDKEYIRTLPSGVLITASKIW